RASSRSCFTFLCYVPATTATFTPSLHDALPIYTVYAKKYHLLQAKIGWNELKVGRTPVGIYVGGDNLLNQKYSLGNDLNAFGGRDRKSTRLNSSHVKISYAVFCLKKKSQHHQTD